MKPDLILCLGNELLTDDGFGPAVEKALRQRITDGGEVEIIYAPIAGFALLDLLCDRQRVIVVDSTTAGKDAPGTIRFIENGSLTPSRNLTGSHQISLPTALSLGRTMGLDMPKHIDILTVEAGDVYTLSESMTAPVSAAVEPAVRIICSWIDQQGEESYHGLHRTSAVAIA